MPRLAGIAAGVERVGVQAPRGSNGLPLCSGGLARRVCPIVAVGIVLRSNRVPALRCRDSLLVWREQLVTNDAMAK